MRVILLHLALFAVSLPVINARASYLTYDSVEVEIARELFRDGKKPKQPIVVIVDGDHAHKRPESHEEKRPIIIRNQRPQQVIPHPLFLEGPHVNDSEEWESEPPKIRKTKRKNNNKGKDEDKEHHFHYIIPAPNRPKKLFRFPIPRPDCEDLDPEKVIVNSRADEALSIVAKIVNAILELATAA